MRIVLCVVYGIVICLGTLFHQLLKVPMSKSTTPYSSYSSKNEILPNSFQQPGKFDSITHKELFKNTLSRIDEIGFEMKHYQVLDIKDNFLSKEILRINHFNKIVDKPSIKEIRILDIVKVERAFIKGTKDLGNRTFERADVECWQLKSMDSTVSVIGQIQRIESCCWNQISKSPISYFRIDDKILFIKSGGFYMLDRVQAIGEFFTKSMIKNKA